LVLRHRNLAIRRGLFPPPRMVPLPFSCPLLFFLNAGCCAGFLSPLFHAAKVDYSRRPRRSFVFFFFWIAFLCAEWFRGWSSFFPFFSQGRFIDVFPRRRDSVFFLRVFKFFFAFLTNNAPFFFSSRSHLTFFRTLIRPPDRWPGRSPFPLLIACLFQHAEDCVPFSPTTLFCVVFDSPGDRVCSFPPPFFSGSPPFFSTRPIPFYESVPLLLAKFFFPLPLSLRGRFFFIRAPICVSLALRVDGCPPSFLPNTSCAGRLPVGRRWLPPVTTLFPPFFPSFGEPFFLQREFIFLAPPTFGSTDLRVFSGPLRHLRPPFLRVFPPRLTFH